MKPTPTAVDATVATACIATLTVDRGDAVLDAKRSDFFERYPAAYLDPAAQVPVEAVKSYQIGGTPLLWHTADKAGVVVNAAVLSDLVVGDATRMRAGESATIGQLTELGLGKMPGRELVTFLIRARAIATYVHIGSELCLVEEHDDGGSYTARFTGEHTYFTNEQNVEPLAFVVTIDPAGVITLRAV